MVLRPGPVPDGVYRRGGEDQGQAAQREQGQGGRDDASTFKTIFLFGAKRFVRMARSARGGGTQRRGGAGRAPTHQAHNDADEAMENTQAEINDTAAALDAGTNANVSSGASVQLALPPALLQRRLDKAKLDAKTAIKEKEAIQEKK